MAMGLMQMAIRNISRNLRRSILSGTAIAVSALSIVLLFALIDGMREDMGNNLKTFSSGEVRIRNAQYDQYERYNPIHLTVPWDLLEPKLSVNELVEDFVPRITFPAGLYINGGNYPALGIGVDFAKEEGWQHIGNAVKEGRLPTAGKQEMLMGAALARELGISVGDSVTLLSTTAARGSNAITLTVTGLAVFPLAALNNTGFWVPLDRVQYFLRMGNGVQDILVKGTGQVDAKTLANQLSDLVVQATGTSADVKTWKELDDLYSLLEIAQYIYYLVGIFFFLLGSTVIVNTTMMVIYERMREIGTLSALGMHGNELTRLFFLEGAVISAIGSAVGVLAGIAIGMYLGNVGIDFTDALSGIDMDISSVLYPRINVVMAAFVYVYAVVVSAGATLIPSRHASRIEPVDALRYI